MAKFKVLLEGENLWVAIDEVPQRLGFFTTRFVETSGPTLADQQAMEIVRADLRDRLLNADRDPPRLIVTDTIEVAEFPRSITPPGSGYTWFPAEDDEH